MNKFRINPKYSLILKKDNKLLCIYNKNNNNFTIDVEKSEIESVLKILKQENFDEENSKIFKKLLKKKILIKSCKMNSLRNTNCYLEVYTNFNINMKDLKRKKILVIGLGGIGCEIILHLISNGIYNLAILDFDKVEDTNLNRQYLYDYEDISKSKVDAVLKKVKCKNPKVKISSYNNFVNNSKELINIVNIEKIDMVVCAAYTPFIDIRIFILEACIYCNVPCIFGGVNIFSGYYGPTFISKNKMKNYLKQLYEIKKLIIFNNTIKASFGPTNSIISSYMAIDIIMTLLRQKKYINTLNKIKKIDFLTRKDYEYKKF